MTSLEAIVRDPRVSQLSVRVKHGSDDIIVDAFWSGSLQTLVGIGPTVEAAVEQMSAEIRRRGKPAPAPAPAPVNFLPILPGDPT